MISRKTFRGRLDHDHYNTILVKMMVMMMTMIMMMTMMMIIVMMMMMLMMMMTIGGRSAFLSNCHFSEPEAVLGASVTTISFS